MHDDANLIIHLGAGKCGSSSLQRALSVRPLFDASEGRRYGYACMDGAGAVAQGVDIQRLLRKSVLGYVSSSSLVGGSPGQLARGMANLAKLKQAGVTPILSCESWYLEHHALRKSDVLGPWNMRARGVLFVRPPLEWLNSAWWQWGAWSGVDLPSWATAMLTYMRWGEHAREWLRLDGVVGIDVNPVEDDVVQHFFRGLGAAPPEGQSVSVNPSCPEALLRFFQRNRRYRPSADAAGMEFVLSRWTNYRTPSRAPWVLTKEIQEQTLEALREDHIDLLGLLTPEVRNRISNNPRWWSTEPYADRPVQATTPPPVDPENDAFIADLIEAILRVDRAAFQAAWK